MDPSWGSGATPQFALAPVLGLAGVVLQLADAENFVAEPFGFTSGGKSTLQTIAAGTVANPEHGNGKPGKGTMADAGDAADVARARAAATGTSAHLDGHEGKNPSRLVEIIRSAAMGSGGMLTTISSEHDPLALAKAAGVTLDPGVLVRLVPIDLGVKAPLYQINPRKADAIKAAARTHYGHALGPFVRTVMIQGLTRDEVRAEIQARADLLLDGSDDAALHRIAQHVAVLWLTAELMITAALLPATADVPALMRWLWDGCLAFRRQWMAQRSRQATGAADRLRDWLRHELGRTVHRIEDAPQGLSGTKAWLGDGVAHIRADVMPDILGKTLGGRKVIRRNLDGLLWVSGATRGLTWRKVPGVGFVHHYRVHLDALDW